MDLVTAALAAEEVLAFPLAGLRTGTVAFKLGRVVAAAALEDVDNRDDADASLPTAGLVVLARGAVAFKPGRVVAAAAFEAVDDTEAVDEADAVEADAVEADASSVVLPPTG